MRPTDELCNVDIVSTDLHTADWLYIRHLVAQIFPVRVKCCEIFQMSYGTGRTSLGQAYPVHSSSSSQGTTTSQFPSSTQFTYSTGNPYASALGSLYPGAGTMGAVRLSSPGFPRGGGRGRGGRGRGRGKPVVRPAKPPPLTSDQRLRIDNHNMKQLVAPKAPNRILNEMVGGGVKFEYTENPPLPPGLMLGDVPNMHTLITEINGETSTGTGPTHEIAKNICSEHAIMGVVTKRYENMNNQSEKGLKSKEEMMLEDETVFELSSVAIFKMLNEWEARGYELPRCVEEVLYANTNQFLPVKQRVNWIRGSNLGFTTPLQGAGRKRTAPMPDQAIQEQKNPVAFLNEIRGNVQYNQLGSWGTGANLVFSIGVNIDGVQYSGTGPSKKEAKRNCARDVLAKLYRINTSQCQ